MAVIDVVIARIKLLTNYNVTDMIVTNEARYKSLLLKPTAVRHVAPVYLLSPHCAMISKQNPWDFRARQGGEAVSTVNWHLRGPKIDS